MLRDKTLLSLGYLIHTNKLSMMTNCFSFNGSELRRVFFTKTNGRLRWAVALISDVIYTKLKRSLTMASHHSLY